MKNLCECHGLPRASNGACRVKKRENDRTFDAKRRKQPRRVALQRMYDRAYQRRQNDRADAQSIETVREALCRRLAS